MVFGYTVEEADRLEDFRDRNPDRPVLAPLIDAGLSKEDCKAMILRAGIELPLMYRMGYDNANCIGCSGGAGLGLIPATANRKTGIRYSLRDLPPALPPWLPQRCFSTTKKSGSASVPHSRSVRNLGVLVSPGAEAADNVLVAASEKSAGGQTVYYLGYNQDMTVEYIQACAMWARAYNYAAEQIEEGIWPDSDPDKHIKTYTIGFPSGHRIVALTSRPSNLRGPSGCCRDRRSRVPSGLGRIAKSCPGAVDLGRRSACNQHPRWYGKRLQRTDQRYSSRQAQGQAVSAVRFVKLWPMALYHRVCLRKGIEYKPDEEAAWVQDVYDFYGEAAEEELDCVPSQGGGAFLSMALVEKRSNRHVPVLASGVSAGLRNYCRAPAPCRITGVVRGAFAPAAIGDPSGCSEFLWHGLRSLR
ncbi:hypothetical protein L1887_59952 [Cichorium endivia]|nr:hypothetical protein L1887_59952 [Cichorium endivia]